jgi:uncharacterized protein (DUF1810 family)
LERFRRAQDDPDSGFESALSEIRSGGKVGHWIWYVFPQLAGLGVSTQSQVYAINDAAEALEYLQDPVLSARLLTITTAVAEQLRADHSLLLRQLMGSTIDARKLVSSLTLFRAVARKLVSSDSPPMYRSFVDAADEVITRAAAEGFPACEYTLKAMTRWA